MNTSRENFIASAALVIENEIGIKLSIEKISEIIGDKMDREWETYEYKEVSPFMDTAPREEIMDIVAMHFLGRYWPTYGENADMEEFYSKLEASIQSKTK